MRVGRNARGTAMGLLAGVALDMVLGDPRRGHPVAAFGRAAGAFEKKIYADSKARGAGYAAVCVLGAAGLGGLLSAGMSASRRFSHPGHNRLPRAGHTGAGLTVVVTAAAAWAVLGGASLGREAAAIARALESGDLNTARRRLPHLCGRDPRGLDVHGLARATVESVAENTSDAVVAPLVCGAVAGVPGLLTYRAVNTLDAMVGHRSPRYQNFGWAAARLDDAANWIPARITGLLTVVCAPLIGGSPRATYSTLRRDGTAHPSPNAGHCEAAFAGALGVRLGGTNTYGERVEHRPELGDGRPPTARDIRRAIWLSRAIIAATAILVAVAVGSRK